jgi:predicted AlkP superfamily pyrophosphatase or phosphodiesterase
MKKIAKPSVLLISIDALKPEFVLQSEKIGIKLPNLQKYFVENGTYASKGVKSVFPTFTYACHQSIITGTHPVTHGTYTNKIFDPEGKHLDAWYWYVSDNVPTLWECAKENGYLSASVAFPTSVGADADYNIPEFWRDGSALDSKLINALSRPQGIVKEVEKEIGQIPGGLDLSLDGDRKRYAASLWLLENKVKPNVKDKPFFMTTYFASYDETAHEVGVCGKEALETIQELDKLVGELVKKAHEVANDNVVVCVVSDHGTINNIADIRPNTLLYKNGLIEVDENKKITAWEAWCQRSGGVGQIKLKDPNNQVVQEKVKSILNQLIADKDSGIMEVITGKEAATKRKGFPEADYVIISKPGYEVREDVIGEYYNSEPTQKAQHGYAEELPDMRASFYIEGVNIEKNKDIGELDLIDIAPTLAYIMGFSMPTADGKNILNNG